MNKTTSSERIISDSPARDVLEYWKTFLKDLDRRIQVTGKKDKYIFEHLGMTKTQFYSRMKNPNKWKIEELEGLMNLIEPM